MCGKIMYIAGEKGSGITQSVSPRTTNRILKMKRMILHGSNRCIWVASHGASRSENLLASYLGERSWG